MPKELRNFLIGLSIVGCIVGFAAGDRDDPFSFAAAMLAMGGLFAIVMFFGWLSQPKGVPFGTARLAGRRDESIAAARTAFQVPIIAALTAGIEGNDGSSAPWLALVFAAPEVGPGFKPAATNACHFAFEIGRSASQGLMTREKALRMSAQESVRQFTFAADHGRALPPLRQDPSACLPPTLARDGMQETPKTDSQTRGAHPGLPQVVDSLVNRLARAGHPQAIRVPDPVATDGLYSTVVPVALAWICIMRGVRDAAFATSSEFRALHEDAAQAMVHCHALASQALSADWSRTMPPEMKRSLASAGITMQFGGDARASEAKAMEALQSCMACVAGPGGMKSTAEAEITLSAWASERLKMQVADVVQVLRGLPT